MNKLCIIRNFNVAIPIGVTEQTTVIPLIPNGNMFLIPENENVKIKKISVSYQSEVVFKSFRVRFRGRNRDISNITENAGDIINPVSGPWNGSLLKNTDLDIMLGDKKNYIEFKTAISVGGLQMASISKTLYSPSSNVRACRICFQLFYE
jgi:hypothetical protein